MEGLVTYKEFCEELAKRDVPMEEWANIDMAYSDAVAEALEARDDEKAQRLRLAREIIYFAYADYIEDCD